MSSPSPLSSSPSPSLSTSPSPLIPPTTSSSSSSSSTSSPPFPISSFSSTLSSTLSSSFSSSPHVILLTGGAGFIGSNVLLHLMSHYPHYTFICLDKLDSCSSLLNFSSISSLPNFHFVKGDCCSSDLVSFLISSFRVDVIMHFAAQTHVDNSFGNSLLFTESNVVATHVLLEVSKQYLHQIKKFIHVSTDEVYGEVGPNDELRMAENHPLHPSNPYAATKVGAEYIVKSYHSSFGLPTIITRCNNVYGPRQFPEKLIPKFILLLSKNRPCPIHGNGLQRRSFIHVDDVSDAFDIILHKGVVGSTYNIGSEEEFTNIETFNHLINIFRSKYPSYLSDTKSNSEYLYHVRDRAFNDFRYRIDSTLLLSLGWKRQKVNFQHGLEETVQWYFDNLTHWPAVEFALHPHPFQLPGGVAVEERETAATLASVSTPMMTINMIPQQAMMGKSDATSPMNVNNNTSLSPTHSPRLRWLVYGGLGWIGSVLHSVMSQHRPHDEFILATARADNEEMVEEEIKRIQPDRVISVVGRTHGEGFNNIDYLEQKGKIMENIRDNLFSPLVILLLCHKYHIHFTSMGTGCIFKYDENHPINVDPSNGFKDDDKPNFFGSAYSVVKGFSDRIFHLSPLNDSALNVRIRMPITADRNKRNFITKILTYEKICSVENSMSVLPEVFPIMIDMAVRKMTGTVNLTNPGYISHNKVLELYREIVDPTFTWKNFNEEEQKKILAADRSNNCLDTKRLQIFAPNVMGIEKSVRGIMREMKRRDEEEREQEKEKKENLETKEKEKGK